LRFIAALFSLIPYLLFIIQQISANEKGDIRLDFSESPFPDGITQHFSCGFLNPALIPSSCGVVVHNIFIFSLLMGGLPPAVLKTQFSFHFCLKNQ